MSAAARASSEVSPAVDSPTPALQLCQHERVRVLGQVLLLRLQVTDGSATRSMLLRGSVPRMRLLAEAIFAAGDPVKEERTADNSRLLAQLEADAAAVPGREDPERKRRTPPAEPRTHPSLDRSSPAWQAICELPVIGPIKHGRGGMTADQEAVLRRAWEIWRAHNRAVPKSRIAVRLGVSDPTILRFFTRFENEAGGRAPVAKPNGRLL